MPKIGNNPDRIHFVAETDKSSGYTYVRSYKTKWDTEQKRSRAYNKRHVGRLHVDGRVAICASFKKDYPQYAQGDWYWGADKKLVDLETYREQFPVHVTQPKEEPQDIDESLSTLHIGATWAMSQVCEQAKIEDDLKTAFGDDAKALLALAMYQIEEHAGLHVYDIWRSSVWLKDAPILSSQRISEVLANVTEDKINHFFKLRHERNIQHAAKQGRPLHYALDNTTISSYSETIPGVEFGRSKEDSELPHLNYTMVCDQHTGEVVYIHSYSGSIADTSILSTMLNRMKDTGFNLNDIVLVTDRGYSSLRNIQEMFELDIGFIQGVRIVEKKIKQQLDNCYEELRKLENCSTALNTYAVTVNELMDDDLGPQVHLHLYRHPDEERHTVDFLSFIDKMLEKLNRDEKLSPDQWRAVRKYVIEQKDDNGVSSWDRDCDAIRKHMKYASYFVIRSNVVADPLEALRVYRMRKTVEENFRIYKSAINGDRIGCTASSYQGKLFISSLAVSIRLMMMKRLKSNESAEQRIDGNSFYKVLKSLWLLLADKRPQGNAYVVRNITKKQRQVYEMLEIESPPKVLF